MEFWTIMLITILSGPLEKNQSALAFKNESLCYEAAEQMSVSLSASYDYTLNCIVSESVSGSMRPKRRP